MRKSNQLRIRALLREVEDGLTATEIAVRIDSDHRAIIASLKCMPDAYIDRWTEARYRKKHSAVWCVVVPPENCPKPNLKEPK
jgi:hypothetical protein